MKNKFWKISIGIAIFLAKTPTASSGVLEDFDARIPALRGAIPSVINAAQATADRIDQHRCANITIPIVECAGFKEELCSRAGGLAQIGTWNHSPHDIALYAVRDWARQSEMTAQLVKQLKNNGALVILFASKAGMPDDIDADYVIDNGAPDGGQAHASINAIANVTLGWMWCCEYASAFSRKGLFPAVTKSISPADSWILNASNDTPDNSIRLYPCDESIPAGELASVYLNRIRKLISDVREPHIKEEIQKSADIIADRLVKGGRVGLAGLGHMILEEPKHDFKSPILGFRAVSMLPDSFSDVLDRGDLLVWVTYAGMNSAWDDYGKFIHDAGLDIISSYAHPNPPDLPTGHLAHIQQSWALPDAEVAIPVPPYAMAPVSAINRVLIARMLDEAVFERGLSVPKCTIADPYVFYKRESTRYSPGFMQFSMPHTDDISGIIDTNGQEVLYTSMRRNESQMRNPEYGIIKDHAGVSYWQHGSINGLYLIERNGKWGALNKNTDVVIEPKFDILRRYSPDLFIFQDGRKFGLCSTNGEITVAAKFDALISANEFGIYASNTLWGVIDKTGTVLSPPIFENGIKHYATYEGLDIILARVNGKTGLFTMQGEPVLKPVYDAIDNMRDGQCLVRTGMVWSVVGITNGSSQFPYWFDRVSFAANGGFAVHHNSLNGEFNADGSVRIPVEYDVLYRHRKRNEALGRKNGKWFVITDNGAAKPFPVDCDYVNFADEQLSSEKRYYIVAKDFKFGIVDQAGDDIVKSMYNDIKPFSDNGEAFVATGGTWRIDANIKPMMFGAKWGVVNTNGETVVEPKYDALRRAWNGKKYVFKKSTAYSEMIP